VHELMAVDTLHDLEPVLVTIEDRQVAVVRIHDEVFAFSPVCTHRTAPLLDGAITWRRTVLCPWHLGTFRLESGRPTAGPPDRPLPVYPVKIVDGTAYLDCEVSELDPAVAPTPTHA
jgi:nitrite reductase/ring-hydroxylating ferredoxin subunit